MGHEHHDHEHDHAYMHEHNIPHEHHDHDHEHEHDHHHGCEPSQCASCAGCDPKAELVALMKYMVKHNAAARERAGGVWRASCRPRATPPPPQQVMAAVSDFEKGNMRLSAVLAAMNAPEGVNRKGSGVSCACPTVYRGAKKPGNEILTNVMLIER